MCVVENSGRFGGTYAAPIVGLMIEKYLKDSITDKARLAKIEDLSKLNLMPPRIAQEIRRQDSLRHSKDSAYLISKGYLKLFSDTIGIDDNETDKIDLKKDKKDKSEKKNNDSDKDSLQKSEALIPVEKKSPTKKKNDKKKNHH
jgi:penicillin-binding protein 2